MPLQMTFPVEPDADGFIDGRVLAQQLIGLAFDSLVPYVDGCHACADNLFSVLANAVLADLHRHGHETGQLDGAVHRPGLGLDKAALARHMAAAKASTRALLSEDGAQPHRH